MISSHAERESGWSGVRPPLFCRRDKRTPLLSSAALHCAITRQSIGRPGRRGGADRSIGTAESSAGPLGQYQKRNGAWRWRPCGVFIAAVARLFRRQNLSSVASCYARFIVNYSKAAAGRACNHERRGP